MLYEVITDEFAAALQNVLGSPNTNTVYPTVQPSGVNPGATSVNRITSYNVCYTKLLRVQSSPTVDLVSVRQTSIALNAQSTESALAMNNTQKESNVAETEQAQAANQKKFLACEITDSGSIDASSS